MTQNLGHLDDCQVNEVGFGHIVVWCFRLLEGNHLNCSAIATITAEDGCQYASVVDWIFLELECLSQEWHDASVD